MTSRLFQRRGSRPDTEGNRAPSVIETASRRGRPIFLIAVAICLAPFTPLLWPDDRVITDYHYSDYGLFQLPIREFAHDEFLTGRFPLWAPYVGCGTPLHAGQQASLCEPILTPLVIAFGASYGIKISLFVHLALAFAGAYRLARNFSVSPWGASLAGLIVGWGAFPVMHLMAGHVTIVDEYAYVPWLFVALNRLLRQPTRRRTAFFALTIGLMAVAGQPQILYYALAFGLLWAIGSLVRGAAAAHRLPCLGWGAAAAVCGALLGAVQLFPSLELTRDGLSKSERGKQEYASQHAIGAADFARLLVPGALGNPLCGLELYDRDDAAHERVGYVGVLPLLLAVYGLTRRSAARWQWGAAFLVLFGLTAALGQHTPLFAPLSHAIPGLTLFRCPGRMFALLTPLVALLAGRGLDAWAVRDSACGRASAMRLLLAASWLTALILFSGGAAMFDGDAWRIYLDYARQHVPWELAASAATGVVALLVLVAVPKRLPPVWCCLAALVATMLDLGDQTIGNFSLEPRAALAAGDGFISPSRQAETTLPSEGQPAPRFVGHADFQFWPGSLNYSELVPLVVGGRWSSIATNEGGVLPGSLSRLYHAIEKAPAIGLSLAACDYVCTRSGERWGAFPSALPRVRLVRASERELVFTPIEEISLEQVQSLREAAIGSAEIAHDDPQNLMLDVSVPEESILVVADLYYPGWQCAIDNRATIIEPANGVFRAVSIEKGEHRIEFKYHPASFRWGAWCSLAGLIVVCGLAAFPNSRYKAT